MKLVYKQGHMELFSPVTCDHLIIQFYRDKPVLAQPCFIILLVHKNEPGRMRGSGRKIARPGLMENLKQPLLRYAKKIPFPGVSGYGREKSTVPKNRLPGSVPYPFTP